MFPLPNFVYIRWKAIKLFFSYGRTGGYRVLQIYLKYNKTVQIPVAMRPKEKILCHLIAGVAGSNPADDMDFRLLFLFLV